MMIAKILLADLLFTIIRLSIHSHTCILSQGLFGLVLLFLYVLLGEKRCLLVSLGTLCPGALGCKAGLIVGPV